MSFSSEQKKEAVKRSTFPHRPLSFMESSDNIHLVQFPLIIHSVYQYLNSILETLFYKSFSPQELNLQKDSGPQVTWPELRGMFFTDGCIFHTSTSFCFSFYQSGSQNILKSHLIFLRFNFISCPQALSFVVNLIHP